MLRLLSPEDAARLREFFQQAGYSHESIKKTLVVPELASRQRRNLPRLLEATREPTTLHALIRWFTVGAPVEIDRAHQVVPDWVLNLCLTAGLLDPVGETLVPTAMLSPFYGLLVATDHLMTIESGSGEDAVLVVNPTTALLYRFTIRRPSRATLDLGTGCGVLALAVASHTQRVVATDLSARATHYTAFNARLNGIENVETLTGSAFDPVEGRRFDLIVSNPPFYITPSERYTFCENDMELDQFCYRLIRQAPQHLEENGYLQMLCEWAELRGQPWQERLSEWLDGTGCDAWIIKGNTVDPSIYAQQRLEETAPCSLDTDPDRYSRWMTYYRDRGVTAIHKGLLAIRRHSGRNWVRIEEIDATSNEPFGEAILRGFAARDFLEAHPSDEEWLEIRPKVSPHAQLDQRLRFHDGHWEVSSLHLFTVDGLSYAQKIEKLVAQFLSLFDGTRTLGDAIAAATAAVKADPGQVRREFLRVTRTLVECGFLLV